MDDRQVTNKANMANVKLLIMLSGSGHLFSCMFFLLFCLKLFVIKMQLRYSANIGWDMVEHTEHACVGINLSLDYRSTKLRSLEAAETEGGTGFTFQSQKGSGELFQILVLTVQQSRLRSMDLEHLVMT